MSAPTLIDELVAALRCLPGVGPKSAQRMAFYLLERDRDGGKVLSETLDRALARIGNCQRCRNLSEADVCAICADPARDSSTLCIVATPVDQAVIERSTSYRGLYFVLMGHLSPLDGVGPEDIGVALLERHLDGGDVAEVILATGSTVEGQVTAHYLGELARDRGILVTRIAQGVPLGGELEFVDGGTLAHAMSGRRKLD